MNTYRRGLTQFEQFRTEFCLHPYCPFPVDHILHFIAHLYPQKMTPYLVIYQELHSIVRLTGIKIQLRKLLLGKL